MRIVDKYFEAYLNGTISDQELKDFQRLLDDEPYLRTELAETLEMRSLLHDDFLRLSPSEDVADVVRTDIAELFGALESDVEEDDDRLIGTAFISGRTLRSAAAGVVAIVLVALAPTLLGPPGGFDSSIMPVASNLNGSTVQQEKQPDVNLAETAGRVDEERSDPVSHVRVTTERSAESSRGEQIQTVEPESIALNDQTPTRVTLDLTVDPPNEADAEQREMMANARASNRDLLDNRFLGLPNRSRPNPADAIGRQRDYDEIADVSSMFDDRSAERPTDRSGERAQSTSDIHRDPHPLRYDDQDGRQRIMFGGSVASGVTTNSSSVSIEGSAYMALGLSESSRIGLEGGSATFRYKKVVTYQSSGQSADGGFFGKVHSEDESPLGDFLIGGVGGDNENGDGAGLGGRDRDRSEPYETLNGDVVVDRKLQSAGTRPSSSGGTVYASGSGAKPQYSSRSFESEASMVYGLVFYDQSVATVSDQLKLHGRVGVGGTDGGVVLNAKAYAAIRTHPNVAWTVGVGGSMLKDFRNDIDFNATYGVNAGVEFGF
jgi:hypothetical protein